MKSIFTSLLVLCAIAINAQFSGFYAPANWSTSHSNGCDNGYIDASGAPGSILIVGSEACTPTSSVVSYGITVTTSGTVSFDWNYTTADCNGSYYDPFGYFLNNGPVQLSTDCFNSCYVQSGTVSIPVVAGDNVAFYVFSRDNFCGRASSTISNFNGPFCDLEVTVDEASVIYNGYAPFSCTTLNATATTSNGPATISGTEVCATGPGCIEAAVTATDAAGCEASATVIVPVVDVVCYGDDGELKVQLCHGGRSICVSPNAVAAHLAHGDQLGECGEGPDCGGGEELQNNGDIATRSASSFKPSVGALLALSGDQAEFKGVDIYPNPAKDVINLTVNRGIEGPAVVTLYNLTGQQMLQSNVDISRGVPVQVNVADLIDGNYTIKLESQQGFTMTENLTIGGK